MHGHNPSTPIFRTEKPNRVMSEGGEDGVWVESGQRGVRGALPPVMENVGKEGSEVGSVRNGKKSAEWLG